jgi:hypothetical protein
MKPIIAALTMALALAACADEPPAPDDRAEPPPAWVVDRHHVIGDVYHYTFELDDAGGAPLRVHRVVRDRDAVSAPPAPKGIMLLHGDFATFAANFAPGLVGDAGPIEHGVAIHLALRGIDVWGVDRRWTAVPAAGDPAVLANMGLSAAIADTRIALGLARSVRRATRSGSGPLALGGFSRGGVIAYAYVADEARRPATERHVRGLVALDVYARTDDDAARLGACARRDEERAAIAAGEVAADNSLFAFMADLATAAPDEPSPIFDGLRNREAMLLFLTRTFLLFAPTPAYALAAGTFDDDGVPVGLAASAEPLVAQWLSAAPPYQAMAEIADGDALWCGEAPLPVDDDLGAVTIPILYVGASEGFGDAGLYTTTLAGSTEVDAVIVDGYGHADLLYGDDAAARAWDPIAAWLLE